MPGDGAEKFLYWRDFFLNVENYKEAYEKFKWPDIDEFNWALDYFDEYAKDNRNLALIWADENGEDKKITFEEMSKKSSKVANFLKDIGMKKNDRALIITEVLPEVHELTLALMKVGGVFIPGATTLPAKDIMDRIERGNIKYVIVQDKFMDKVEKVDKSVLSKVKELVSIGDEKRENWINYGEAVEKYSDEFTPAEPTKATDPCYLFFTSGTTAKPKLVVHTHIYPVGHLTTMYWLNAKEGDVHYNISSPGWAKYAWSSIFAPWNAGATIFVLKYSKFDASIALRAMEKYGVTTLCAPLSVLKLLVLEDLSSYNLKLRQVVSAGEPLIPEVLEKVEQGLGVEIREGYGQTETTCLIANFPGEPRKKLSFGKPAPGYHVEILDDNLKPVKPGEDGQICVKVKPEKPLGLLARYEDEEVNSRVFQDDWYLTGDAAYYDEDGYFFFIGRKDDVFKSLDYRISPFEVESEIAEHPAVLEVAVVPTVDDRDRIVPKAFIVLKPDYKPGRGIALDIFKFIRKNIAPYKRPRSIEFLQEFPKTISAKVMRRELRRYEEELIAEAERRECEFRETDFAKELDLGKRV